MKPVAILILMPAAVLCFGGTAFSQSSIQPQEEHPLEPADTSSPRATLESFLKDCNALYSMTRTRARGSASKRVVATFERVVRCMDLSQEPDFLRIYAAKEATVCLKEIFDRIPIPEDGFPAATAKDTENKTLPDRWSVPHTEIEIVRMPDGPRQGEYLFSADTVRRSREFFERIKDLPYKKEETLGAFATSPGFLEWFLGEPGWPWLSAVVHRLPDWARTRVAGQAVWQWVGLVIVVALGAIIMFVAYRLGRRRAEVMRGFGVLRYSITLLFPVAAMLVPVAVRNIVEDRLVISGMTLAVVNFSANLAFLFAALVVLVAVGNRIAEAIIAHPKIHPHGIDAQFIRIVTRVLSLTAATIVFLEGGRYLGIPLTTLLAGAGVGGLALALAAQDTLKNLFGSMMIVLDKPYRVGERIVVKDFDGVVSEIGLRSTKIRLLTGHVATILNEEMARSHIENIGRRPHIRRIADMPIPLDTPPEKAERAVEIVRGILQDHEGLDPDYPPRVYLNELNRDSLNIRIIYWFHPPNYWDFLAFSQEVNLRIKREFAAEGIPFALPASTTFMAQDAEHPLELKMVNDGDAVKTGNT